MLIKSVQTLLRNGFTLIELMIAIVIGMLVTAAAIAMYITTIQGSSSTLKNAQLAEELNFSMRLITDDIRRAGYWGGAVSGSDSKDNPFDEIYIPTTEDCILYSYDADGDATGPESDEYYGFKLDNGVIKIKTSGSASTDCTTGNWEDLTDNNIVDVTSLQFCNINSKSITVNGASTAMSTVTSSSGTGCLVSNPSTPSGTTYIVIRQIGISLQAESVSDTDIQVQVNDTVNLRNNHIFEVP